MTNAARETVPKYVGTSFGDIKKYLLQKHVILRGTLNPEASMDHEHPELHRLPMEMIKHNPMRKTIDPDDSFFNGYCGYVQDRVKQERQYLFLLFLYLRDQGVGYGGEMSEFTPDAIEDVRVDCKNYIKNANDKDVDDQVQANDITDEKYKTYREAGKKRMKLTKEERNAMRKHGLKMLLGTENVTHWAIKAMKGKKTKYNNIKQYKECIGVKNETERLRIMAECANKNTFKVSEEDNAIIMLEEDEKIRTYRHCVHGLNIIQIAAPGVKLDEMGKNRQIEITEDNLERQLKEYMRRYWKEMTMFKSKIVYKEIAKKDENITVMATDETIPITANVPGIDNINALRMIANKHLSEKTQLTLMGENKEHDNIGTTNIIDNVDYIRYASEIIKSCFCIKFEVDKKNTCLIDGKSSRSIYIRCPWEIRGCQLLPRKSHFTVDNDPKTDLVIRKLSDVYTELPESINGSKTGVDWVMDKINKIKGG